MYETKIHRYRHPGSYFYLSSFIENLRKRRYQGGEIKLEETLSKEGNYTSYIFSYPSDNLKIYGMINTPDGDGPFPVILLNHGYFNQSTFQSGDGTHAMADTEVDPEWSKELNKKLKKENKEVEYFEYPGQDHNFRNLGWDVISRRTIEFFDRYLK